MIRTLAARAFGLPRGPFEVDVSDDWVSMPDGVRLHHVHVSPSGRELGDACATVLVRTPYDAENRIMVELARWIAEHGFHVVVQNVRGRHASEGKFVPFAAEAQDGGAMLDWLAEQKWCDSERIALTGPSYLGIAAWAALGARPQRVRAFVPIMASRDLYDNFYGLGGVFSLANSFEWATWIGENSTVPEEQIDLVRGMTHLPLREADRVACREVGWYRDWLDHPRRDAFWDELTPPLPEIEMADFPATLIIGGWYDFFQKPALREYRRLIHDGADIHLLLGPWSHGRAAHRDWRPREAWLVPEVLREMLRFLKRQLASEGRPTPSAAARVRYFDLGERQWKRCYEWPAGANEHRFELRIDESGSRRGRLEVSSNDALAASAFQPAPRLRLRNDPFDPIPSLGGARFGAIAGAVDQRPIEARADLASFTTPVQRSPLRIAGDVRCRVTVETDALDLDVHARLLLVLPDGKALNLCDGVARARWRGADSRDVDERWLPAGQRAAIEVDLGSIACTIRPGQRLRLHVSGSSFPRFERNPGSECVVAKATPEDMQIVEWSIVSEVGQASSLTLFTRD